MDQAALERIARDLAPLSRRFTEAGHRLYLVGGVVRDLVRGDPPDENDIDLTTDAPPATSRDLVAPVATALWTQGERFGTIGAQVAGRTIEVTTHRAETYVAHSRKPAVVFGTDLTVDLSRRDFTINAMALELPSGSLIDPFGGCGDLAARRLRTPLDPVVSFRDDPLRMLRAARFVARFGLDPDPELVAVATASARRLGIVSVERVHDELERLLATGDPAPGLRLLAATGLLEQVLPAVSATGTAPDPRFGGRSRWDVALSAVARLAPPEGRRALLLWPVAEASGADGVDQVVRALRYSSSDRQRTRRASVAVRDALVPSSSPEHRVRAVTVELGPDADVVWSVLDALAPEASDAGLQRWSASLSSARHELAARGELDRLAPPLDGRAVMDHLGCGPGPVVGEAMAVLQDLVVTGGPVDEAAARAALDRWWAARRS